MRLTPHDGSRSVQALLIASCCALPTLLLGDPAIPSVGLVPVASAGLAVGLLYRFGIALWPAATLGFVLSGVWTGGFAYWSAFVIPIARTVEVVVATAVVTRAFRDATPFETPRLTVAFAGAVGVGGMTAVAIAYVLSMGVLAPGWDRWVIADVLGITAFAPLPIVWRNPAIDDQPETSSWQRALFALLLVFMAAVGFSGDPDFWNARLLRVVVWTGLVVWSGYAFGRLGGALFTTVWIGSGLVRNWLGYGFYPSTRPLEPFAFLGIIPVASLIPMVAAAFSGHRRRIERELRAQNERLVANEAHLARVQQLVHLGSYEADLRTGKVIWSPELLRLLGVELGHMPAFDEFRDRFVHPDDQEQTVAAFRRAMDPPHRFELQSRIIRADGEIRHAQTVGEVELGPEGVPVRIVGSVHDVTDQVHTRELEAALRQKRRMESLGTLAGGIAHDFNNLLSVIVGNTQLLRRRIDEDAEGAMLQEIERAGGRASELIQRILAFARPEPGEGAVDLCAVVSETISPLRRSAEPGIDLTVELPAEAWVRGDAGFASQIVTNLTTNALAAIDGSGSVLVAVRGVDDEPSVWELVVRDTGVGIAPEQCEQIFDPFFTTRDARSGTGLGLATVQAIVSKLGGRVAVESQPGVGSTFRVRLPRRQPSDEEREETSSEEIAGAGEPVLIVDDDPQVLRVLDAMFRDAGYATTVEMDPEKAAELLAREPDRFRLLVTDQIMPLMRGDELIAHAREHAPGLPTILVSGYHDPLDEAAPSDEVFYKPVDPSALLARAGRLIQSGRPLRVPATQSTH